MWVSVFNLNLRSTSKSRSREVFEVEDRPGSISVAANMCDFTGTDSLDCDGFSTVTHMTIALNVGVFPMMMRKTRCSNKATTVYKR